MSPWNIIGWAILIPLTVLLFAVSVFVSTAVASGLIKRTRRSLRRRAAWRKSRNIRPEKGQRWNQDGSIITVTGVGNGKVFMQCGTAHFSDTFEEFSRRRKNKKFFLLSGLK